MHRIRTLVAHLMFVGTTIMAVSPAVSAQGTVKITFGGTGAGTVRSVPANAINCPTTCSVTYNAPGGMTLTAVPNGGSMFTGWTGSVCTGTAPCVIRVSGTMNIKANFATRPVLTVIAVGPGVATSVPPGIACTGATCTASFNPGTVQLLAVPRPDAIFMGYTGGGCGSAPACSVSLAAATTVTARFALPNLVVNVTGDGSGRVTSSPGTLSCTTSGCAQQFRQGDSVTLQAASLVSTFGGWGGACASAGTAPTCTVRMTAPRTVSAAFNRVPIALVVNQNAGITGSSVSTDTPTSCTATCVERVATRSTVIVHAHTGTAAGELLGWTVTGATDVNGNALCAVVGQICRFTVPNNSTPITVRALFGRPALTLNKAGTGTGTIARDGTTMICAPNCSGNLSQLVDSNTRVTVTATAGPASVLRSVAAVPAVCNASGCTFDVAVPTKVTATFVRTRMVTIRVTGAGTVSGLVANRSCGPQGGDGCSATMGEGDTFTLTALRGNNTTGQTWGGAANACGAADICPLTVTAGRDMTITITMR